MNPKMSSQKSEGWTRMVRKTKRIFKWIIWLFVIFLCGFVYWKFFFTYSEGYRAGLLQKFSSKGVIFKTYEGEMILSSVASTRDIALASEKFFFTVTSKSMVRQFDTLQGSMIIVHYKQKNAPVFWRGDSPYLVDSVKVKR